MRYELVPSEALHAVWDYVRPGLERVRQFGAVSWWPEDIYAHVRFQRAALHIAFDGDERRGFFVTEARRTPHNNEPSLHVWVIWAEPTEGAHFAGAKVFVPETIAWLDQLTAQVGAKLWTIEGRKGWERFLDGVLVPTLVKYERRLGGEGENHGRR